MTIGLTCMGDTPWTCYNNKTKYTTWQSFF